MQNAFIYKKLNKNSAKYNEIRTFLKSTEELFTWRANEVVLDAGCGPGDLTAQILLPWLPEDFSFLLGVDVSTPMIQHAQQHYSGHKLSYSTADIGSTSGLTYLLNDQKCAKGFDKVFSFFVLHWLQDLGMGLQNLHIIMNQGAQGLVVFPIDRVFQRTYHKMGTKPKWNKYELGNVRNIPPFPEGPDPNKEFKNMLSSVGFKIIKCEVWDNLSKFTDIESLKNLVESLNEYMTHIPSELKNAYLNECVQEMTEMGAVSQAEGQFILKQSMILAVFSKI